MKVIEERIGKATKLWRTGAVALASALVALVGLIPTPALAITRSTILTRAHSWVKRKVKYSQQAYFQGYRRDCSGFVSMAWKTGRSYTSRTIGHVAQRIPLSKLQPGDAVHTPGHVTIFVAWKNKARGLYVAMEESSWGRPALRAVRPLGAHATALRYRHLSHDPAPVTTPSDPATPAVPTTGSVLPTVTAGAGATSVVFAAPSVVTSQAVGTVVSSLKTTLVALVELPGTLASAIDPATAPTRIAVVPLY